MNLDKLFTALDLMKEALSEEAPKHEPLLNISQLAKACGVSRNRVRDLFRECKVQTYDQGKKAKASDVERALEDKPVQWSGPPKQHQAMRMRATRANGPIRIQDVMKK